MSDRGPLGTSPHRRGWAALLVLVVAACGGTPAASVAPTGPPAAASYAEYAQGYCAAMEAMTRAIGNPDTGADSDLSFALEEAIERGDIAAATELAARIRAELQTARQEAARIAGWSEGAGVARHLDRFLAAFEVYLAALMAAAPQGLTEAQAAAQQAFEGEGAFESWMGMLEGVQSLMRASDDPTALMCDIPADPRNPDQ